MQVSLLIAIFLSAALLPPDAAQVEIRRGDRSIFAERGEEGRWTLYETEHDGSRDDLGTYVVTSKSVAFVHNNQEHTVDMTRLLMFDDETDWSEVPKIEFAKPEHHGTPIIIEPKDQGFRLN